ATPVDVAVPAVAAQVFPGDAVSVDQAAALAAGLAEWSRVTHDRLPLPAGLSGGSLDLRPGERGAQGVVTVGHTVSSCSMWSAHVRQARRAGWSQPGTAHVGASDEKYGVAGSTAVDPSSTPSKRSA